MRWNIKPLTFVHHHYYCHHQHHNDNSLRAKKVLSCSLCARHPANQPLTPPTVQFTSYRKLHLSITPTEMETLPREITVSHMPPGHQAPGPLEPNSSPSVLSWMSSL